MGPSIGFPPERSVGQPLLFLNPGKQLRKVTEIPKSNPLFDLMCCMRALRDLREKQLGARFVQKSELHDAIVGPLHIRGLDLKKAKAAGWRYLKPSD
jgi:hypothetical protein